MTTFEEAIKSGNGRLEFVWHVRGMPWAVTTSKEFATYLSSATTERRAMFGSDTYNAGANYFADEVDVWPLLEPPGPQTITNDDAMSALTGGTWTAKISDIPQTGASIWPHSARTSCVGLEGLQSLANPRIDRTIISARLGSALPKTETGLSFIDDSGSLLGTECAAASDADPLVLWIGSECMAITDGTTTSTTGTGKATYRGILGTVEQFHAPNRTLTGAPSLRIANAPLNGIQSRPYALYAFVYLPGSRADTVIGPAMVRHGKVSSNINYSNGMWSIECLPWWSWLDTDLTVPAANAPMAKYVLTRYGSDAFLDDYFPGFYDAHKKNFIARNPPHVVFREYDSATDTTSPDMTVWLCDEWESVTYDTVEDLENDICSEMTTASAADGFSRTYTRTPGGPACADLVDGDMCKIWGDLAVILQWGDYYRLPTQFFPDPADYPGLITGGFIYGKVAFDPPLFQPYWVAPFFPYKPLWPFSAGPWIDFPVVYGPGVAASMCSSWLSKVNWYTDEVNFPGVYHDVYSFNNMIESPWRQKPSYIVQWGWTKMTMPAPSDNKQLARVGYFPVPIDPVASEARLWVREDYSIQSLTAGSLMNLGTDDPEHPILSYDSTAINDLLGLELPSFSGWTSLGQFEVDDVGLGPVGNNYIVVGDLYETWDGEPTVVGIDTGDFDPNNKKYIVGQALIGYDQDSQSPLVPYDYWPLSQSFILEGDTLSEVFLAVLGHPGAGPTIAEAIQADHIPDYETIDWDLLDTMTSTGFGFDTKFQLRYEGSINLWKLLNEELKFHNLTPTWEWDSTEAQFRIRFKRVNVINSSLATVNDRIIDSTIIAKDASITAEHASAWQVNKLAVKLNWNQKAKEFDYVFDIDEESGYAPTGGRTVELEIAPQITRIKNIESTDAMTSLISYLGGHLENMMDPRPAASFNATLAETLKFGVGSDTLFTAEDIHDPFTGAIGVTDWPSCISSTTTDFSNSTCKYTVVMGARRTYGWAPTCLITESHVDGGTGYVHVTDVEGSGQEFSGTGVTDGWYDYWFFGDLAFNNTMSAPEFQSSDRFLCTLTQRGTKTPIVISGVVCEWANPNDYATAHGAAENMLILNLGSATYDPPLSAYDANEEWYITHDQYDTAIYDTQRAWIFLADSTQQIEHDTTGHEHGREWE